MAVLINLKICDNAKECNGIAICPTSALSWDAKKKSIKIDNTKCISCGKCEKSCMVGAIHVAKDQKEYEKIEKEIKNDKRKVADLFVDRYGAQPIHPAFLINEDKFQLEVLEGEGMVVAEIFNDNSIRCLLKSIPMKELMVGYRIKYRKVEAGENLVEKYKIKELPVLIFFRNGEIFGKIEGFYENKQKDELAKKIGKIMQMGSLIKGFCRKTKKN